MKKLNITKERFEKSRYFQKKYGTLEYVSESGKLFKTDKGKVLAFNESEGMGLSPDELDDELSAELDADEIENDDFYDRGLERAMKDYGKKIVKETKKPMKKAQKKEQWWFDIPGAKHIYHGDWSDPEIQYKGFSINYWDVIEGMSNSYRDEHPEDKDEKGFDAWLEEQGGPGGYLQGELDNCVYACLGDEGLEDKEWLGIPDAYKVKEVQGQGDGDFVLYKDCLVNVSDFDYYDKDYDDYFTYDHDPQGFEAYYIDKTNRGELIDQLNSAVRGLVPNAQLLEEGFKDAIKSGWKKVKDGAKL